MIAAKNTSSGDLKTYLCARNWDALDYLRRAAGVLAAVTYYEVTASPMSF